MPATLKCPNPSCPFTFDPTLAPAGSVLACPQCGMRFTLAAQPKLAEKPSPNTASPSSTVHEQNKQPEPRTEPEPRRDTRRAVSSAGSSQLLPMFGIFAVLATAGIVGYLLFTKAQRAAPTPTAGLETTLRLPERNLALRVPTETWTRHTETQTLLKANIIGLKRTEGDIRASVEAKDYATRNPQLGELREVLKDRLQSLFEDIELSEDANATLGGQKATRYSIRGNSTAKLGNGTFVGVAYTMALRGFGYWVIALAPEAEGDKLGPAVDELLKGFELLNERAKWSETSSSVQTLVGERANYRLTDSDRWWKKLADPLLEDPQADLLYEAEYQFKVKRDLRPRARLVVVVLDPKDDAITTLERHVKNRFEQTLGLKSWTALTSEALGDSALGGEKLTSEVVRFQVAGADANTSKLVVMSAMTMPDTDGKSVVVGAYAVCPFSDQPLWEKRLVQLVGSLREGK